MKLPIIFFTFFIAIFGFLSQSQAEDANDTTKQYKALTNMLEEMSNNYSNCAALYTMFMTAEETTSKQSSEYITLQQKATLSFFSATEMGKQLGLTENEIKENVKKRLVEFGTQIKEGNNQNKFTDMAQKCNIITKIPMEYLNSMKKTYGLNE